MGVPRWVRFDVSAGFSYDSNLSFVLWADDEDGSGRLANFYSDDWSGTSADPYLEIHTPEPGTLALVGLGLAGLVARRRKGA